MVKKQYFDLTIPARKMHAGIKEYDPKTGEGKRLVAKTFRKTFVKYALEACMHLFWRISCCDNGVISY